MFDHIGEKIKSYAKIVCIIICVIWILGTLLIISDGGNSMLVILSCVILSFVTWISSFLLYGFGELVSNSSKNNELLEIIVRQNKDIKQKIEHRENEVVSEKLIDSSDKVDSNSLDSNMLDAQGKEETVAVFDVKKVQGMKRCSRCGAICNVSFRACDCCGGREFE